MTQLLARFAYLGLTEIRNIRRDSLLGWMVVIPLVVAVLARWLVPLVDGKVELDLRQYDVLITSCLVIFACPVCLGFVVGMMLLDERDEGVLTAMQVTPLTLQRYLAFKLIAPMAVSTLLTLLTIPLAGLTRLRVAPVAFAGCALVGSLWAPILALMMVAFAKNKLQGFVLMRISNLLLALPVLAWFVRAPWQYCFAAFPAWWVFTAFWRAAQSQSWWWLLLIAAVFHLLLIYVLLKRFQRVVNRVS